MLMTEIVHRKAIVGIHDACSNNSTHFVKGMSADGWARGMLTKCTVCHQQVHVSDVPSQAGNIEGKGLTR